MSSSKGSSRVAICFGIVALLAIPVAALAAWRTTLDLLHAEYVAVPVAVVCGLVAIAAARRARFGVERSVRRTGERAARAARWVAWAGLYLGVTGVFALAFYGVLQARS